MRLSFEFFPPRTPQGQTSLIRVAERLNRFRPTFFSVTYGAGGSTRDGTQEAIGLLLENGFNAAPHLSMGGDGPQQIRELLDVYAELGAQRIVALRGDLPSGMGRARYPNNAESLVGIIREHSDRQFHIEVAGYPETHPDATSPQSDLEFLKRKIDAGADSVITQYFYHPHAFFDFLNRARQVGITVPIVPGIMPITNFEGIVRFSEGCGADIPRWIRQHLDALQHDKDALIAFGVEVVTRLCTELLGADAPGLHFYTLNRWGATSRICENLGFDS